MRWLLSAFFSGLLSASSYGQDVPPSEHARHMMQVTPDTRAPVDFPPAMQQHMLGNMRSHLQVMTDILLALSNAEYSKAADLADQRLGLGSAGASACMEDESAPASGKAAGGMDPDREMGAYMPAAMRKLGLAMHQSASDFAAVARATAKTGDAKPAMAALSRVTQNCVGCHTSYRIR